MPTHDRRRRKLLIAFGSGESEVDPEPYETWPEWLTDEFLDNQEVYRTSASDAAFTISKPLTREQEHWLAYRYHLLMWKYDKASSLREAITYRYEMRRISQRMLTSVIPVVLRSIHQMIRAMRRSEPLPRSRNWVDDAVLNTLERIATSLRSFDPRKGWRLCSYALSQPMFLVREIRHAALTRSGVVTGRGDYRVINPLLADHATKYRAKDGEQADFRYVVDMSVGDEYTLPGVSEEVCRRLFMQAGCGETEWDRIACYFGLGDREPRTLHAIAKDQGVTRQAISLSIVTALSRVRDFLSETPCASGVEDLEDYLTDEGGLRALGLQTA